MDLRKKALLLLGGAGGGELNALLAQFQSESPDGDSGFYRDSSHLYAAFQLFGDRYLTWSTPYSSLSADAAAASISALRVHRLAVLTSQDDASVTLSGSWGHFVDSAYYGGGYSRANAVGDYMEFTTSDSATRVGVLAATSTSTGIHIVTINGDATAATSLPTAQELVTAGTLESTALIANGGTLNPTDRVWDSYANPGLYELVEFADDLEPGTHTVRGTVTGYKNPSASGGRMYIHAVWHNGGGLADTARLYQETNISTGGSRVEFAIRFQPDLEGVTTDEWMGHSNTEFTTSVSLEVDGNPVTLNEEETAGGASATLTVTSYLRHPQTGTTDVGLVTRTYTMDAQNGIRIQYDIEWQVDGSTLTGYTAMLPLNSTLDRGSLVGDDTDYTLTADDSSTVGNIETRAAYGWQATGDYGGVLYLNSLDTVNNWQGDGAVHIEDRADGLNKIYVLRSNGETINANDVWSADYYLRFKRFDGGAEAALARE